MTGWFIIWQDQSKGTLHWAGDGWVTSRWQVWVGGRSQFPLIPPWEKAVKVDTTQSDLLVHIPACHVLCSYFLVLSLGGEAEYYSVPSITNLTVQVDPTSNPTQCYMALAAVYDWSCSDITCFKTSSMFQRSALFATIRLCTPLKHALLSLLAPSPPCLLLFSPGIGTVDRAK